MTTAEQKHELREHLSLISTSAYFLLCAKDEDERLERYAIIQEQIDAIIAMIDKQEVCPQVTCAEVLFQ